jgi:hypothetical protein
MPLGSTRPYAFVHVGDVGGAGVGLRSVRLDLLPEFENLRANAAATPDRIDVDAAGARDLSPARGIHVLIRRDHRRSVGRRSGHQVMDRVASHSLTSAVVFTDTTESDCRRTAVRSPMGERGEWPHGGRSRPRHGGEPAVCAGFSLVRRSGDARAETRGQRLRRAPSRRATSTSRPSSAATWPRPGPPKAVQRHETDSENDSECQRTAVRSR